MLTFLITVLSILGAIFIAVLICRYNDKKDCKTNELPFSKGIIIQLMKILREIDNTYDGRPIFYHVVTGHGQLGKYTMRIQDAYTELEERLQTILENERKEQLVDDELAQPDPIDDEEEVV